MINKELLLEDIKFPLYNDGYSYIWDADNNMIAQFNENFGSDVITPQVKQRIIDCLNSYIDNITEPKENKITFKNGEFFSEDGSMFLYTRGWGRLQYKSNPEQRQDNISKFILDALNSQI